MPGTPAPAMSCTVLSEARSSRNVPSPAIDPAVTVKLLPLEADTLVTAPAAVPVAVSWKSLAATSHTFLLKTTL